MLNFTRCNTKKPFDLERLIVTLPLSFRFLFRISVSLPSMKTFFYLALLSCIMIGQSSLAQKRKSMYSYKYKSVRMSKQKAQVVCPIFENSKYPYHGIGIKVGDPVAVTYKYYQSDKFAIAIDGGSAASGLYSKHHRERFENSLEEETSDLSETRYVKHEIINEYVVEAKLLYQTKADKIFPGLQSYAGVGWQFRQPNIRYAYFFEPRPRQREIGEFESAKLVHGPTFSVGLEYAYFKIPVSAFVETSLFVDIADDQGWTKIQGGVGVRYVF